MAQILDQYGNPIERKTLSEPQTSRLGHLAQEFAGHPSRGLTPPKLARILEEAEQGNLASQAELFMDMEEKDGHIFAEMSKRKRALLTLDWDVAPPRNASRAEEDDAAWLREVLQDMDNFEDVFLDALDAIGHGFSALEVEWHLLGREWLPKSIDHRPQSWFQTGRDDRNQIRLRDNSLDGAALRPFGWILHTHKAKSGYVARGGLHRVLAWPFLFKNYSVRDLAEFLEIYGLPLRLGKYPTGASDVEKATLLRAVTQIGHNAAGIIPEGMSIDFQEAAKGQHDPFEAMIDWCERTQSKAILGGTLTSQADGQSSTNALGNVHNEVRHDLMVSDARQLAGTLSRDLLYPLLALNRGVKDPRRLPRLTFDTQEAEDLSLYADALPKLTGIGMKIPSTWAHDKLRIPQPDDGEAVLGAPTAEPKSPSVNRAALRAESEDQTHADEQSARLSAEAEPAMDEWISGLRRLVDEAQSLEALRDAMLVAYGSLDSDRLAKVMALGFAAAELAGMSDVRQEAGLG
jgi:phage gp29-like protein